MVVHAGDVSGVVAGVAAGVAAVCGDELPVDPVDQEVFDLRTDIDGQAELRGRAQLLFQDDSRRVRPGFPVHVWIAVHDRQTGLDEGDGGERVDIGNRDEVGVLGLLSHVACGVAGEPDAVLLQLCDGLDRDEFGAGLAGQGHEHREDERGATGSGDLGQRLCAVV